MKFVRFRILLRRLDAGLGFCIIILFGFSLPVAEKVKVVLLLLLDRVGISIW